MLARLKRDAVGALTLTLLLLFAASGRCPTLPGSVHPAHLHLHPRVVCRLSSLLPHSAHLPGAPSHDLPCPPSFLSARIYVDSCTLLPHNSRCFSPCPRLDLARFCRYPQTMADALCRFYLLARKQNAAQATVCSTLKHGVLVLVLVGQGKTTREYLRGAAPPRDRDILSPEPTTHSCGTCNRLHQMCCLKTPSYVGILRSRDADVRSYLSRYVTWYAWLIGLGGRLNAP